MLWMPSKPITQATVMHHANWAAVSPCDHQEELVKVCFGAYPLAHATYHVPCVVL